MLKTIIRKTLIGLHLDITKNLQYDRLTTSIMKKHLKTESNCIDVGCHKGEMLELMLKFSPKGKHLAFEPIPEFAELLRNKFQNEQINIYEIALSDKQSQATFNYVLNAPAYSGLKKRKYDVEHPDIKEITVKTDLLDNIISSDQKIGLIKIDVEGGEFGVLKGALNTIKKNKPLLIFECGLGASEFYGTKPDDIFDFISIQCELKISTLKNFNSNSVSLNKENFCNLFEKNTEYYFVAHT